MSGERIDERDAASLVTAPAFTGTAAIVLIS